MWEAIELMARLREMPSLDDRMKLFASFLDAEFKYDGFVYGIAMDTSSFEAHMSSFLLKEQGMHPEWMRLYVEERLALKDLTVYHAAVRPGMLHQSRIFAATDRGDLPEYFAEVPRRVRDFSKSGFFCSFHEDGQMTGMGVHSSTMTPEQHDAQFVRHGHIVVELCRQFHEMASWRNEIISATGLSQTNLEILRLRSLGLMDKQIIEITGHRHENSVAQHMARVSKKLHTTNERQTLVRAARLGLIGQYECRDEDPKNLEITAKLVADQEGWLGQIT